MERVKRWLAVGAAALVVTASALHAWLGAEMVDRGIAGALLSATGYLSADTLAVGAGFLAVRAFVFLAAPSLAVGVACWGWRRSAEGIRRRRERSTRGE